MRIFKLISALILIFTLALLTACANIEGGYLQLVVSSDLIGTDDSLLTDSAVSDSSATEPEPSAIECDDSELVRVTDYIPDAVIDMRYASANNFTKGRIYDFDDAYLRYGTVKKLQKAAEALRLQGYKLLIWDAYRPQSAQYTLYENAADKSYVAEPDKKSRHSAGDTVDVSIVKLDGSSVEMPTDFDDFSAKGDRDYSDVSKTAGENSVLLEKAMSDAGFNGYTKEWWHYTDTDAYDYDDIKNVKLANKSKKTYVADCNEYINLRKAPAAGAEIICRVPANAEMTPFAWYPKYIGVIYNGQKGYVSADYVK